MTFIESMLDTNHLLDVRHIYVNAAGKTIVTTGIFDSIDKLRAAVSKPLKSGSTLLDYGNLYVGLNRPMVPVSNDFKPYRKTVKDSDIQRYTHLLFDFDPVRQTEDAYCPSTDEEHLLAKDAALSLMEILRGRGWPTPLVASSGNGWHLVYRVELGTEIAPLLREMYKGMKAVYSTDQVGFDSTVYNPCRITRFYSTVNRKGKQTADRPYRKSFCMVSEWEPVPVDKIKELHAEVHIPVARVARRAAPLNSASGGNWQSLDIVGLFQSVGLYGFHSSGNVHAVRCPWQHEHHNPNAPIGTDTIIMEGNGDYPNFFCHHDHCSGRYLKDVMQQFGGNYATV